MGQVSSMDLRSMRNVTFETFYGIHRSRAPFQGVQGVDLHNERSKMVVVLVQERAGSLGHHGITIFLNSDT